MFGRTEMVQSQLHLFRNKAAQKDLVDLSDSATRLVEAREECTSVTRALGALQEVVKKYLSAIYICKYIFKMYFLSCPG